MARSNKKLEDLLHEIWLVLGNIDRIKEIPVALAAYGFDEARIEALRQSLTQARKLVKAHRAAHNKRDELIDLRNQAYQLLDDVFALHRQLLRRFLKEDDLALRKLGLHEKRSKRLSRLIAQGETFYSVLRDEAELQAVAADYNLTPDVLDQKLSQLADLRQYQADYQSAKTQAQVMTKKRDAAIDELERHYADLKDTARRALRDQSQYLEALGFGPVP